MSRRITVSDAEYHKLMAERGKCEHPKPHRIDKRWYAFPVRDDGYEYKVAVCKVCDKDMGRVR